MIQKETKIKYFCYVRKSSEDKERQALSIPAQKEKIKERFPDLDIEFIEETKSAFIPYNRPKFTEMFERIEKSERQGLVAWHPDRLSRNEKDAGTITYLVRTGVVKDLKFGTYYFENNPEGIWMLQMALSQSQYESAKKGRDVKRGLGQKAKMGHPPYEAVTGYLNTPDKSKGYKTWIKDPERFHLVRKMWDLMLTGSYTPPKILDIANNKWGFTTVKRKRLGGTPLSRSVIYKMFTNPAYYSSFEYPVESGVFYKGAYEPMITEEEYDRVQMLLGRKGKPRPKKHEFTFTGSIRCGECGCLYTAETKKKLLKSGEIREHTYYHCTRKTIKVKCNQRKNIPVGDLELSIEKEIEKYTILPEFLQWALEGLNKKNGTEIEDRTKVNEMRHKNFIETQKELDELTKMRYRQLIDDETFLKERNTLQSKIAKFKEDSRETETRSEKWLELTEKTFSFATYARKTFLTAERKEGLEPKKEILLALGKMPIIKDEKLVIEPFEWLIPIKNNYPALEAEYLGLEPAKIPMDKTRTEALASVHTRWLRG